MRRSIEWVSRPDNQPQLPGWQTTGALAIRASAPLLRPASNRLGQQAFLPPRRNDSKRPLPGLRLRRVSRPEWPASAQVLNSSCHQGTESRSASEAGETKRSTAAQQVGKGESPSQPDSSSGVLSSSKVGGWGSR